MKKLLAVLLATTMLVGTMSVSVFAADTATGSGGVTVTGKTGPELPDPDPDHPDPDYPVPTDPADPNNPDNAKNWAYVYHKDLLFKPGTLGQMQNSTRPSVVSDTDFTEKKLAIILEDYTGKKDANWNLKLQVGKFLNTDGDDIMPSATLDFSGGEIITDGQNPAYKPTIANAILDTGAATATQMVTSQGGNYGSPGHWMSTWDVNLKTVKVLEVGSLSAPMYWTIAPGLV